MESENNQKHVKLMLILLNATIFLVVILSVLFIFLIFHRPIESHIANFSKQKIEKEEIIRLNKLEMTRINEFKSYWRPKPVPPKDSDSLIAYGKELIMHTAQYLGPKGSIATITNGMNCQNCHLDAGTKIWGNNYGAVFSTYPKYRARSGTNENIFKRINDCMERSLNGKSLDTTSTEILAIKAYIEHIGSNVKKGEVAKGSGIYKLDYLDRACDPEKGKILYASKCASCHQPNGEGLLAADNIEYTYPPLWGKNSYNIGAGLYRMSRMAGYIKYNMPQGASFERPLLTDEEAWDIAAFVNSQDRPKKNLSGDWPNIAEKPFDHPYGPFADPFSATQHKYGPYKPIADFYKKNPNK